MTLFELATAIDIKKPENIPEKMHEYYPLPQGREKDLCSLELIERLQEKFDFFGEYLDDAKRCWAALQEDELRLTWVNVASLFLLDCPYDTVKTMPAPDPNGTPAGDLMLLMIHLPSIEGAYEKYIQNGFSKEESLEYIRKYYGNICWTKEKVVGRPAMTPMYFRWMCLYAKARIFNYSGFNFEAHRFTMAYVLKNKKTGQLLPLSKDQRLHRTGQILGTAGAEEEEGAFDATFKETESAFIGHPVENNLFAKEAQTFSKDEWEILSQPGDFAVGIHIPKNTDMSRENIAHALQGAGEIVKRIFAEFEPKMFTCSTWLLDPTLEAMLKPESKILGFASFFTRFPRMDKGKSVFNFVFPQSFKGPLEELPEDTSLMRAIKKRYLNGEFIVDFMGVIEI